MNIKLLVSMAQSCAKDSAITYDEFDKLYADLSLREKYKVVNILYENGIDLVDEHIENEASVFEIEGANSFDSVIADDNNSETVNAFFVDSGFGDDLSSYLIESKEIHQSNAILCSLIQQRNRQAAQDLCIKNKKLVDKCVVAYRKIYGNDLEFEDLEQVGFIGLLTAAQKFNPSMGAFGTYAVYWIKQVISREIMEHGFIIRIPVHMMDKIIKFTKAESQCPGEASLYSKIQHIAQSLGLQEKEVKECLALRENILSRTSLSTLVGKEEETELGDFIPAEEDNDPVATEVFGKTLRGDMEKCLSLLTDRERRVLMMRNGWDGGRPMTLDQIGLVFNVTRERIRQIEVKALRKLRHPSRSKIIKDYLED